MIFANKCEKILPQIGWGERGNEELLRLPVVSVAGPDFAWWQKWESVKMTKFEEKFTSGDGCQLPGLGLHHLVLRDVLDRLQQSI